MNPKGHNGVKRPKVAAIDPQTLRSSYIENLYKMSPYTVSCVFNDPDPSLARVDENFNRSSRFLELLNRASLEDGTVLSVLRFNVETRNWEKLTPAALARLNSFIHRGGYKEPVSFRGLRYNLSKQEGGLTTWKAATTLPILWEIVEADWIGI